MTPKLLVVVGATGNQVRDHAILVALDATHADQLRAPQ